MNFMVKTLITCAVCFLFTGNFTPLNAQCQDNLAGFEMLGDFNGNRYYQSNGIATAANASQMARNAGGHLVSIDSEAENQFVSGFITSMVHIGLNDSMNEGSYTWDSGEQVTYTNFDLCAFCSDNDAENDFAIMHQWNGGWSFTNRWSMRKFIIEIECNDDEEQGGDCEENIAGYDFIGQNGSSSYFISQNMFRPGDAQAAANALGGNILSIESQEENDFIFGNFDEFVWIGLNDEASEGILRWSNGDVVDYTNFGICVFCSDNTDDFDFVIMAPWDGTWSYASLWNQRKYILEITCEDDGGEGGDISLNCPLDIQVQPNSNGDVQVFWPSASANTTCTNGGLQISNTTLNHPGNSDLFPQGSTSTINYEAVDACGNREVCSFTITVGIYNDNPEGVGYTANDQVTPYTGVFRPGANLGYNPPWTDDELAELAAGNPGLGIEGIGARTIRPGLYDIITSVYGYDIRLSTYEYYHELGMDDLTMIVGFPAEWHRDLTDYCGNGTNSAMFRNLYSDIWDNGENGTPYNDDNFYAAYLYEVVSRYGEYVKFWEIWNEPGFDFAGVGWRQPGDPVGNWWDRDPNPCENILRAPIEHYVRTLRISWEIIKTLQPDDYVAVAGVGYESFLDAILRNTDDPNGGAVSAEYPLGGGAYFDVMGFHSYPDIDGSVRSFDPNTGNVVYTRNSDVAAQGLVKRKNSYDNILSNYGYGSTYPSKEWIMTEFNVPRRAFKADAMTGGDAMQINYMIKAVVTAMQNDIRQMHVYNLGDQTDENVASQEFDLLGMYKKLAGTEAGTAVKNPAAVAYKTVADMVYGTSFSGDRSALMGLPANVKGGAFRYPNGSYMYVLWAEATQDQSENASAVYSFPTTFPALMFKRDFNYSETNQTNQISSQNIFLSSTPIFISDNFQTAGFAARGDFAEVKYLNVNEVYPNPAIDEVFMKIQNATAGNHNFQIFDVKGNLVEEFSQYLPYGYYRQRLDIEKYPSGMYFVIIKDQEENIAKTKFTKLRD